jgi:hypothetical protein
LDLFAQRLVRPVLGKHLAQSARKEKIMALAKTVTTVHGFEAVNAYHRVEAVRLESKTAISFHIRSYTAVDKPFFEESVLSCTYEIDGKNPIAQAYEHLKTLPEFAGATDC